MVLADTTIQEFPYLAAVGLDPKLLRGILTPGSSEHSWQLEQKPKIGFYANLLDYQRSSFPELSQRQVGRAIFHIDQWMRESVNEKFSKTSTPAWMKISHTGKVKSMGGERKVLIALHTTSHHCIYIHACSHH